MSVNFPSSTNAGNSYGELWTIMWILMTNNNVISENINVNGDFCFNQLAPQVHFKIFAVINGKKPQT